MKKLFTLLAFMVALFVSQHAMAASTTYYGKATVQVAEESTGRGTVYFNDNETEQNGTSTVGPISFHVNIVANEGYKFDKFTDDAGDEAAFNAETSEVTIIALSTDPGNPTVVNLYAHFVEGSAGDPEPYHFSKTVSVGNYNYATMVAPVDVELPEGIKAFLVKGVEDGVLQLEEVESVVPAATCVLLQNTTESDITLTAEYDEALNVEGDLATGLLHGSYVDGYTPATGAYMLQFLPSVAFNGVPNVPISAFECYLAYEGEETSLALTKNSEPEPEPEPDPTVDITIGAAGFTTTYFEDAVKVPVGVTAYYVESVEDGSLHLARISVFGNVVPAHVGVLLEAAEGTYSFEKGSTMYSYNSMLQPIAKDEYVPASDEVSSNYVLQNLSAGLGFYKVQGADEIRVSKNSAYLRISGTDVADVKDMYLLDAQETAIKALSGLVSGQAVYDINGRKLSKMQRGLNIVGGVKVMVK